MAGLTKKGFATIIRVAPSGVAYGELLGGHSVVAFSFNKIKGYRGQSPGEIDLKPGKIVALEFDANEKIELVDMNAPAIG
jgi:hypothetical protein